MGQATAAQSIPKGGKCHPYARVICSIRLRQRRKVNRDTARRVGPSPPMTGAGMIAIHPTASRSISPL